ncbi:MAG: hypothetical protein K8F62_19340 [Pseudorhodoplanes sp.]|nr:hypothetical protein [Pseudorhodoplanes sp.]
MMNIRVSCLLMVLFLGIPAPITSALAQTAPAELNDDGVPRIRRLEDGRSLLSFSVNRTHGNNFFEYLVTFDFGRTRGLGGGGVDGDKPVVSEDKSLIAVTHFPATKTSYVHLVIRQPNGDLTVISSVNSRVAKMLNGRWANAAGYSLAVNSISGRIMQLSVFDHVWRNNEAKLEEFRLKVRVGRDGTLTLVR